MTSGLTNGTEVNFNLSSNLNGSFNVENNYPPKVILIDIQVSNIRKGFANVPSANIKVWKTQLSKFAHLGGFTYSVPSDI